MKNLFLSAAFALLLITTVSAQEDMGGQTSAGNWLVEINTGFGSVADGSGLSAIASQTGLGYSSGKNGDSKFSQFSGGFEAGYFVAEGFAIKGGLGFSTYDADNDAIDSNAFSYMLGSKYYINGMIPVQLDFRGSTIKDADENPMWIGLQGGYALFIGDSIAIEPGLRYQFSLNSDAFDGSIFSLNVGFSAFF